MANGDYQGLELFAFVSTVQGGGIVPHSMATNFSNNKKKVAMKKKIQLALAEDVRSSLEVPKTTEGQLIAKKVSNSPIKQQTKTTDKSGHKTIEVKNLEPLSESNSSGVSSSSISFDR